MKFLLSLLLIAAAAAAGYHFEPELRGYLTGSPDAAPKNEAAGPVVINLADYSAEQFPKQVQIRTGATITLEGTGMKMKSESASKVDLIRMEGSRVIFNAGTGNASVGIEDTDLAQQLLALPKNPTPSSPVVKVPEAPAPPVAVNPEPTPAPEVPPVAPMPDAPPVTEADPAISGDSVESSQEPTVSEAPASAAAPAVMTPAIAAMQASLKNDELTEIKFDQVIGWTAGPDEVLEGVSYQTGLASCETTTMFGSKVLQAKAYVQGNKVVRWVWPKSGAEIK